MNWITLASILGLGVVTAVGLMRNQLWGLLGSWACVLSLIVFIDFPLLLLLILFDGATSIWQVLERISLLSLNWPVTYVQVIMPLGLLIAVTYGTLIIVRVRNSADRIGNAWRS